MGSIVVDYWIIEYADGAIACCLSPDNAPDGPVKRVIWKRASSKVLWLSHKAYIDPNETAAAS